MIQDLTAHYLRISEMFQSIDVDTEMSDPMRELLLRQIRDTAELLLIPPTPTPNHEPESVEGHTRESLRAATLLLEDGGEIELPLSAGILASSVISTINNANQKCFERARYGRRVRDGKVYIIRNR